MMSHEWFVGLSYAATGIIAFIMWAWIILDGRARRKELARLEAQGVKRRSGKVTS